MPFSTLIPLAAGGVGLSPTPGGLPGSGVLRHITDGIGWFALALCLVGLVIGAATWALGSHSNNYQYSAAGRRAVLISGLAALVVGAAPVFVNFFFHSGQAVR